MTVYINGTTGISGVDGSAGTPAVQGTDTNTGVFYPAADTVGVSTGGSERMRVDSSGNVGIGTTNTTDQRLKVKQSADTGASSFSFKVEANANDTGLYIGYRGAGAATAADTCAITATYGSTGAFKPMTFLTSDAERMRIDSSGNVGIGTSSPAVKLDVNGITGWQGNTTGIAASVAGANAPVNGGGNLRVVSTTTQAADLGGSLTLGGSYHSGGLYIDFAEIAGRKSTSTSGDSAGYLSFGTRVGAGNITERMRIDSSGNLLVGTTGSTVNNSNSLVANTNGSAYLIVNHINGTGSGTAYAYFGYNGTGIGTITQNGTAAVAYNTTSDYRLKENVQPLTGALARVAALKPVKYTWKSASDETGEGFIAHELAEVCPHAVTGEKDAVDADGNPVYQGIDTSFLVATLTAAIQEQQALITALTARIEALEAK